MIEGVDRLSMEALEQIDRICCQFEQAWKQGRGPQVREYLGDLTGATRAALLRELLALDLDYRCRSGQNLKLDQYVAMLPEDRPLIEKAIADHLPSSEQSVRALKHEVVHAARHSRGSAAPIPEGIGRYRILEKLGAGGFGVVYRGFDDQLQRDVAIKVPHRDSISGGLQAQRFVTEARLVASLNHNGIVPVYDAGQTETGEYYVVSKYMEGGDLAARIRWARPVYAESAGIILQLADALHYAHLQGLVHRDVKPSNLLSDAAGGVYIADFGEALQIDSSPTGAFVGTPAYMSPEQARGEGHRVDARTDIYALGVVFYELLTGSRPFASSNVSRLLEDVISTEPRPPRELDSQVPAELERICLRAMSKRASARYATALDLKQDLQQWLQGQRQGLPRVALATAGEAASIIPKGLRSFGTEDAEFFLRLLPGPYDRDGLPEAIRFWRSKIASTDADRVFRVGVMYGPSGCGKSSLLKAGLLPRLPGHLRHIYVEARAKSTEQDLVSALQQVCRRDGKLIDLMRLVRSGQQPGTDKVLIVIDHFEQWLHGHHDLQAAELTAALRQCDGVGLQCLLLVRDDFWMPVTRFMRELELPLLDHENALAIDLFDVAHARKVLLQFGQAYECLPRNTAHLTRAQSRFLDESVAAIAENGAIVPIRLSVFAEMMKAESWEPSTLKRMGRAGGLGVTFLDRCFVHSGAPAPHRMHVQAARQVLKALLPDSTVHIRGHVRSGADLLQASGYEQRPELFVELLQLLDHNLRLVTPIARDASVVREAAQGMPVAARFYQLTHDFMVGPIREWITQGQRQTVRGRAELCLSERAALWTTKPENRQLPGLLEWTRIRLFTRPASWNRSQQIMMRRAGWRFAWQLTFAAAMIAVVVYSGIETAGRIRAKSSVNTIRMADSADILNVVRGLNPQRKWLAPLLHAELDREKPSSRDELNVRLALLRDDPEQLRELKSQLFHIDPRSLIAVRDGIKEYADLSAQRKMCAELWQMLDDSSVVSEQRFRAACVLAALDRNSPNWENCAEVVVQWLLLRRVDRLIDWLAALDPVKLALLPSLEQAFRSRQAGNEGQAAAIALSAFLADGNDTEKIIELIQVATPTQLPSLVAAVEAHGEEAVTLLKQLALDSPESPRPPADLPLDLVRQVESADGIATTQFVICQTLAWDALPPLMEGLFTCGFRLSRIRPFQHQGILKTAAIWSKDGIVAHCEFDLSADKFRHHMELQQQQRRLVKDVAGYYQGGRWQFVGVWAAADQSPETRVTLAVPYDRWQDEFDDLVGQGFTPQTIQYFGSQEEGLRATAVWIKRDSKHSFWARSALTRDQITTLFSENYVLDCASVICYPDRKELRYGALWNGRRDVTCKALVFAGPEKLVANWPTLRAERYQPVSISVGARTAADELQTVSVWHAPSVGSQRAQDAAIARSNVVIALLSLGHADADLPFLKNAADPSLRSYLIHRMGPARIPAEIIDRYLRDPSIDAERRQALILSLGGYNRQALTIEQQLRLSQTIQELYRSDADSGVHSAAQWLLGQWQIDVDDEPKTFESLHHREWFTNTLGQTMVVLEYSPPSQYDYATTPPTGHRYAIATTETTIKEFDLFRANHPYDPSIVFPDECPVAIVNWYDAAAYCNWLSEREGIPSSEWCYLPNDDGDYAEGMKVAPDWLKRNGYRLPLAAEWSYAASTGLETPYFFGSDLSLLDRYAWTRANSRATANPVATLRPNVFGLFDVLGNVKEWCQDGKQPASPEGQITDADQKHVAGGYFLLREFQHRNYVIHENPVALREIYNGIRVTRTINQTED